MVIITPLIYLCSPLHFRSHLHTRMAHHLVETNPHFIDPEQLISEKRRHIPATLLPRRDHDHRPQDQRPQDERSRPLAPSPPERHHEGQPHLPLHVWVPPIHHEDQHPPPQHRQGQQRQPLEMWMPPTSSVQGPAPKKQKRQGRPGKEVMLQPQLQEGESSERHPSPGVMTPQSQGRHPHEQRSPSNLFLPQERRTKPLTWFAAAFCVIFWLVLIIGGLIILIVYLVSRPRSPSFDINSVTLNSAYLDMGYLLNADLSLLANFTNPNKKVNVAFSNTYLHLYYDNTLIATQRIESFSAARGQSMFANIHMVASQVTLSINETLLLQRQIENNRVLFKVKGAFRARSKLGGLLKYSYWLHIHCSIMVSSPPTGVLIDKRCKTKH